MQALKPHPPHPISPRLDPSHLPAVLNPSLASPLCSPTGSSLHVGCKRDYYRTATSRKPLSPDPPQPLPVVLSPGASCHTQDAKAGTTPAEPSMQALEHCP